MSVVSFRSRLAEDAFPITYEAVSPRGANYEKDLEGLAGMANLHDIAAVNLTSNPSARVRIDPAMYGHLVQERTGVEVIPHVTCRDSSLAGIQSWLFGAWALGIRNVLVMTGDHPKEGDYPDERRVDSVNAIELIAGVKRFLAHGELIPDVSSMASRYANRFDPPKPSKSVEPVDYCVGAPAIPWRNNEVQYTTAKRNAGADFYQTQITWEEGPVLDWLEKTEEKGITGPDVPVLVGVAPLKTPRTMAFMHSKIPLVKVPKDVQARLNDAKDCGWESVEVVLEMTGRLKDGLKDRGLKTKVGLHVLPINSNELGNEIVRRAKGV